MKTKKSSWYFTGIKASNAMPILSLIAKQNKLQINKVIDLNIAKAIMLNSITYN